MKMNMNNEIGKLFEAAAYAAPGFDTRYKPREPEYMFVLKKWLADPKAFGQIANPEDYVEGSGVWFVKALKLWYAKNKRPPTHDEFHRLTTSLLTKGLPRYLLTDLMDLIDKVVPHGHDESGQDVVTESDAPVAWQHADGSCQCHRCAKRRYGNRLMNPKTIGLHPVYDEEGELEEAQVGKLVCRTCKKALGKGAQKDELPEKRKAKKSTKKMVEKCSKKGKKVSKKTLKEGLDSYEEDKARCPACKKVGDMVYNQGTDSWSCQQCGKRFEPDGTEVPEYDGVSNKPGEQDVNDIDVIDINGRVFSPKEDKNKGKDGFYVRNKNSILLYNKLGKLFAHLSLNNAGEAFLGNATSIDGKVHYQVTTSDDNFFNMGGVGYNKKNMLIKNLAKKYILGMNEANEPPKDEDDLDLDDILAGDEETSEPSEETSDEVRGNPDDDGEAGDHASWTPKKGMPGIGMTLSLQKESEDGYRWKLEMIDRGIPFEAAIDGEVDISAEDKLSSIVIEYKKFQAKVENILSGFSN